MLGIAANHVQSSFKIDHQTKPRLKRQLNLRIAAHIDYSEGKVAMTQSELFENAAARIVLKTAARHCDQYEHVERDQVMEIASKEIREMPASRHPSETEFGKLQDALWKEIYMAAKNQS